MCLGTVGQITTVGPGQSVQVRAGGREITASLLAVSDADDAEVIVAPGDWVLVHSGLVLNLLSEPEARDALELRETPAEGAT